MYGFGILMAIALSLATAACSGAGSGASGSEGGDGDGDSSGGDGDDHSRGPTVCTEQQFESAAPTASTERVCTDLTVCTEGQYVAAPPTASSDRACTACADGSFSSELNAAACTPWTPCAPDHEGAPGTATADRVCGWLVQYGGADVDDDVFAMAVDGAGDVLVAGFTSGDLDGNGNAGAWQSFVRKLSGADGTVLWTHQFGTGPLDVNQALAVAVDATGDVLVGGRTAGALEGASVGGEDAFVRKLAGADGSALWTRQLGSTGDDAAHAVGVDAQGDVYVAGEAGDDLTGDGSAGNPDAFVVKLSSADGTTQWATQFGTPRGEYIYAIDVDDAGLAAYVGGLTSGDLPSGESRDVTNAFFGKLSANDGGVTWTTQFGMPGANQGNRINAVVVVGDELICAGSREIGLDANGVGQYPEAFVGRWSAADGGELWTQRIGSPRSDTAASVAVDGKGDVLVAGTTNGALDGGGGTPGDYDGFVRKLSGADPSILWTETVDSGSSDSARAVAVNALGEVFVAGFATGDLDGDGEGGAFVTKLDR